MPTPFSALAYIWRHPLASRRPFCATFRYFWWQTASRWRDEIEYQWLGGATLVVRRGMTGATGNIYCGLHEFADMGFVLHALRAGDLFVDVGANVGSYTILAAAVCGAQAIAIEPDPLSMAGLRRNVRANGVGARVETAQAAVGAAAGVVRLTLGRDTMNRVASDREGPAQTVRLLTLDEVVDGRAPVLLKMDVEGYEAQVVAGAAATLANESLLAIIAETADAAVRGPIEAAGFRPYIYDPYARTISPPSGGWSAHAPNSLFLRDLDKVRARVAGAPKRTVAGVAV